MAALNLLLADSANGVRLPAKPDFPFILAVEDKWGYKCARWIEHIELPAKADYRGFWEKRVFNNQGDQSGPGLEEQ